MSHTYTNVAIHALFATKGRQPWLDRELRSDLFAYMAGIIKHLGARPLIVDGFKDHVHLLFILPEQLSLADLMEKLKANSSRWLHERSPSLRNFAWQTGYTAFSVSQSSMEQVRAYIATQEEHHRKRTFHDEVVALLRKHGIEPDSHFDK
ncbi:MAG TPA: IS200/IS605 family transposase [Candidatus Limnocylindrales bacterium]|nr:IS200/IS605 family transposase [Candidatus Limnocylindrales bacterium]